MAVGLRGLAAGGAASIDRIVSELTLTVSDDLSNMLFPTPLEVFSLAERMVERRSTNRMGRHRMRRALSRVCMMVLMGTVGTRLVGIAAAQQTGANAGLLRQALTAAAQGQCPATIMTVMLKATCDQQQPRMGQMLSQRGPISRTEFLGTDNTSMGPVEVYRVHFPSGPMVWLASTGPDGKLVVLWTPG